MRFNPKGEDDTRPSIEEYQYEDLRKSYNNSRYDWNPLKHPNEILRVSKSSLGTFNWCPKQYWFQYFAGLKGETVYYHTRGLNVHDAIEYFWGHIDEHLEPINMLMGKGYEEQARAMMHDVIPLPPEGYAYGEEAQIRQWVDWQFERYKHTDTIGWKPVGVEANIHVTRMVEIDNTPIPIHMRGYIDTIFENDDGDGFALMELKTGKWKNPRGRKRTQMRKEMQFYRMMLEYSPHHEFLPITHWGWEFPGGDIEGGDGTHIYYEPVKDARFTPKSVEKSIVKLMQAHIDDNFPADASDIQCGFCDFFDVCPKWTKEEYVIPEAS